MFFAASNPGPFGAVLHTFDAAWYKQVRVVDSQCFVSDWDTTDWAPVILDLGYYHCPALCGVVRADLERSGFFRPLPSSSFPEPSPDIAVQPNLSAWKSAGAQALVNGVASVDADGRLRADFRLWDTSSAGNGDTPAGQGFGEVQHRRNSHTATNKQRRGIFCWQAEAVAQRAEERESIARFAVAEEFSGGADDAMDDV